MVLAYWLDGQILNVLLGKRVVCAWATWAKLLPNTTSAESMSLTLRNLLSFCCVSSYTSNEPLWRKENTQDDLSSLFFPLPYQADRQNLLKKEPLVSLRFVCLWSTVTCFTMWTRGPVRPRTIAPLLGEESASLSLKLGLVNAIKMNGKAGTDSK